MSKDDRRERLPETDTADYHAGICPYFRRERGGGVIYCECATLRFPDKQARRDIVYRFCAHPEGYHACPLKQALDGYYERKYARDGEGGKP